VRDKDTCPAGRGPLRVERPLRGVYTGLAGIIGIGPPVGRANFSSDQREDHRFPSCPDKLKRRANARATRSGPVRQDMKIFVDVVCLEQKWVWRGGIIVARR
jgi:hypothetical protein